ncbi:MAG: bifunctional UDP-N-acetylglucosamine diphosphorylase/glucosamine-1-phosphate N-acetyltransferase GlmU [Dehalococcoidia bacterium]
MTRTLDSWTAVVLAAGAGKRMRSSLPKVLHPLAGRPMVRHVVDAARAAGAERCVVIVGPNADGARAALGDGVLYAVQNEPLGTGHALAQAKNEAGSAEQILVLNGDVPLITPETLRRLAAAHEERNADLTFLTAQVDEAGEYGCVQRDGEGRVTGVVEAPERQGAAEGPAEINSGQYCFRASWLWPRLAAIPASSSGEQYLTSLVMTAVQEGSALVAVAANADEVRGINDRVQLAEAEAVLRARIVRGHQLAGVTFVDPATAYVDAGVAIGADTMIEPNTHLKGATTVGAGCRIGPDSTLRDASVGDRCVVVSSTIEEATLEEDVDVGPYSHLRPGAYLCSGVHIGNFAEVKNARLGRGVKMGHFSYIGDAEVGDETNIGAGAITCNFDGEQKHRTVIGRGVFIGSDSMLVAPVTLGDGARTGAGSVVTKDVPAGALAAGAPARVVRPTKGPRAT